jgi:proteasome lid subunit RPN8/RPN11
MSPIEPSSPCLGVRTRAWIAADPMATLIQAFQSAVDAEPCGLLLGRAEEKAYRIREAVVLRNVHPTPLRGFALDPDEHLRAVREARERELEPVGVWHGHLDGPCWPGRADLQALQSLDTVRCGVLVILARGTGGRAVARAFTVGRRGAREIPLRV